MAHLAGPRDERIPSKIFAPVARRSILFIVTAVMKHFGRDEGGFIDVTEVPRCVRNSSKFVNPSGLICFSNPSGINDFVTQRFLNVIAGFFCVKIRSPS